MKQYIAKIGYRTNEGQYIWLRETTFNTTDEANQWIDNEYNPDEHDVTYVGPVKTGIKNQHGKYLNQPYPMASCYNDNLMVLGLNDFMLN